MGSLKGDGHLNMKKFANLVEKYLIRSIVICLVLLVVVQGLMTHDSWRFYLSWGERLEGQVIEYPVNTTDKDREDNNLAVESPYALLTIAVEKYSGLPKAKLLINEKEVANFKNNEIQIKVMAGDVVEIDATNYNFPIEFKIDNVSENLSFPKTGDTYIANQSLVMIGKIIVK